MRLYFIMMHVQCEGYYSVRIGPAVQILHRFDTVIIFEHTAELYFILINVSICLLDYFNVQVIANYPIVDLLAIDGKFLISASEKQVGVDYF
jgi:hypothetical protein